MPIVLANGSKAALLEIQRSTMNGYYYGLYVSNTTPIGATVLGDFTESTDSGYTGTGRQNPAFTAAVLNASNQGQVTAPNLTWTFSYAGGTFTVYGYFVSTSPSGGTLVFSERAGTPFTVTAAGQTYTIAPKYLRDTL